ncbi:MAG: hypothetical protein ACIAS6_08870 [Phycisphaerales bacterium JB060]
MSRRAKRKDAEFLTQCQVLAKRWQDAADPSAFGVTEAEVGQFLEKVLKAAETQGKARRARLLARARFGAQREAFAELRGLFGALVGSVDVKAKRAGARHAKGVYSAAGIDPPEKPGPRPAPAAPSGFDHTLTRGGSILVTFTIDDAARGGLLYEVQRQTMDVDGRASEWLPMDIVGDKRFLDENVPSGLRQVLYRVRAMRATGVKGPWSYPVTIPFGTMQSEAAAGEAGGEGSMDLDQGEAGAPAPDAQVEAKAASAI